MAILNILKKKESEDKNKKKETEKTAGKNQSLKSKEGGYSSAYQVLRHPHISEKSMDLTEENKYVFNVNDSANKSEIKKEIENLYKVDVIRVNIVRIPKKRIGAGRISGFKKGCKKAIIKIKEGQKIEIMPK